MRWQEVMWSELDGMDDLDQIIATGAWITEITQEILTRLGDRRREKVLAVLERPDWDYGTLADSIGSRSTTIRRLAEEGRSKRREMDREAA